MQEVGADYSIVHPATVCGHSEWAYPEGQPLVDLIRNLALGRFKAVPGSARHWLPLVSVDYLVKMMTCVAFDPSMVNRQVLALYEHTPNLQGMLEQMAQTLDIEPPPPCTHRVAEVAVGDSRTGQPIIDQRGVTELHPDAAVRHERQPATGTKVSVGPSRHDANFGKDGALR